MLEIRSLGKRYPGGTVGLEDFSLERRRGRARAARSERRGQDDADVDPRDGHAPDVGHVPLGGAATASRDPLAVRRVLGYLPQDFGVYDKLTAREFLAYLGRLKGLSGADLVAPRAASCSSSSTCTAPPTGGSAASRAACASASGSRRRCSAIRSS